MKRYIYIVNSSISGCDASPSRDEIARISFEETSMCIITKDSMSIWIQYGQNRMVFDNYKTGLEGQDSGWLNRMAYFLSEKDAIDFCEDESERIAVTYGGKTKHSDPVTHTINNKIYLVENSINNGLDLKPTVVNISSIEFHDGGDLYITDKSHPILFKNGQLEYHVHLSSGDIVIYFLNLQDAVEYISEQSKILHKQKNKDKEDLSSKLKEFAKQKAAQVEDIDIQELESLVIAGANWMLENKK